MPDSRLKLLVVIVDISAGTGTFCKNLGRGLRTCCADTVEPSLLMMRSRPLTDEERTAYEQIHTTGSAVHDNWRRFYEMPLDILRLRRTLRQIPADVIFTIGTYSNLLVPMVRKDVPIILSEHMNMSRRVQAARFGWIMRRLMRRIYPRHTIVCAARGITRDLEQNFGATRTAVIPNGLDLDRVRTLAAEDPGPIPAKRNYAVAVGRLTAQKDFATLLRGFAAAREAGLELDLVIVGDGEERTALDELGRVLHLNGIVHFVGQKTNPYPWIKRARFLALTSLWEGFSYVPIEAMALDVPVIATCSEGPAAILEDGQFGLLVSPGDVAALGSAMLKMNDPSIHERFVTQSQLRARQLSLEPMAMAYRDLFLSENRNISRSGSDTPPSNDAHWSP